jgi:hypothetical protein
MGSGTMIGASCWKLGACRYVVLLGDAPDAARGAAGSPYRAVWRVSEWYG